ncbi:MAG: DUF1992 domain-containing protein [Chloroflexi bacterium]|nr:DUF1992 domain-containing protein [Chloroflexota bacterium]MBP8056121.1 DUF1992 domain-containing protein [Chloroflexota bacterium]
MSQKPETTPPPTRQQQLERKQTQWQDSIEEAIQEAQANGKFDNLPGKGKPLTHLNENLYAPGTEMAYQLLKDNDFTLDWIARRNRVQGQIDAFREECKATALRYQQEWHAAAYPDQQQMLIYYWRQQLQSWENALQTLNKHIRVANLHIPLEHLRLITLGLDAELKRLGITRNLHETQP